MISWEHLHWDGDTHSIKMTHNWRRIIGIQTIMSLCFWGCLKQHISTIVLAIVYYSCVIYPALFVQVWSSADGPLCVFCDESSPRGGEDNAVGCSGLPTFLWGGEQHSRKMFPCTLTQQCPPGAAVWRGAHGAGHQCCPLDGISCTHTHKDTVITQFTKKHSLDNSSITIVQAGQKMKLMTFKCSLLHKAVILFHHLKQTPSAAQQPGPLIFLQLTKTHKTQHVL